MKKAGIIIAACAMSVAALHAADCEIHLMVTQLPQTTDMPIAIDEQLANRLTMALTNSDTGVSADPDYNQFFIGGKVTSIYKDVVPGPPKQDVIHGNLTLYIGDQVNQTVFATKQFELRGVGTSFERALIQALSQLNGKNRELQSFVEAGRKKVLAYYDSNYPTFLAKARKALSLKQYDEALYFASSVPECCKGFPEAASLMLQAYNAYMNNEGAKLLAKARSAWAADPTSTGAALAMSYLDQIDPDAAQAHAADALRAEIAAVVKSDCDFEYRHKYETEVDLERRRIEAARAVGQAWGNNQQPSTNNWMWLR